MADDAGALLVRSGLVTANALDDARARVASIGGTLGEQLVTTGAIADDALTDFYRARLLVPQVNPNTLARLTPNVVAAIPGEMAIELRAIPVSLDGNHTLTIAMSDPSDRHAVDEIAFFTGAYIVRAIATQMQIAWCLAHYYGHVTLLGQRLLSTAELPRERPGATGQARPPRTKGLTGKVNASRHRAVAPVTGPVDVARPRSDQLDVRSRDASRATGSGNASPNGAQHHTATPQLTPPGPATTTSTRTTLPSTPAASSLSALRIDMEESDLPAPTFDVGGDDDDGDLDLGPPPDDSSHRLGQATERAIVGHGAPDRPRARSISGEIRAPIRRAPSIRPPLPGADDDDDDEPVIVISRTDVEPGATRRLTPRRRIVKSDPPELKARAGEVDLKSGADRAIDADEPRIVIDQDALATAGPASDSPHESANEPATAPIERRFRSRHDGSPFAAVDQDSTPILLDRPRGTPEAFASAAEPEPEPEDDDDDHDDDTPESIVVLDARKPRSERHTQVGVAPVPAPLRHSRDTEATGVPAMVTHAGSDRTGRGLDGPTAIDLHPAPPGDDAMSDDLAAPPAPASDDDTNPYLLAPPPAPAPAPPVSLRSLRKIDYDAIDDGWGPPGTTIPPPLLGAIPGSEDDDEPSAIPMPNVDSSPLVVASAIVDSGSNALARALDDATGRALDVIRRLERAETRDQVVETMIAHLGEAHQRAGFFVTRHASSKTGAELSLFAMRPRPAVTSYATLRLDRPSTLQDVVGTRLPYRGPMHDDASRTFLIAVLGACPPEILLVPVAVRERVVGVLFGEHRQRHTFDDQIALAARAAGMALERILKARRT